MLTESEIKQEIQEEIDDTKNEIEETVALIFSLKKDLAFYRKALACNHIWKDSDVFNLGGIDFIQTECTKCGYQTDTRRVT